MKSSEAIATTDSVVLLNRARGGEREAFTELVEQHHAELVRIAYAVTGDLEAARDSAQLAWIKAWQRRQDGDDRALDARFGDDTDEYWLALDHGQGRQVAIVHVDRHADPAVITTIDRAGDWMSVGAPQEAGDGSALVVPITPEDLSSAAVLVPNDDGPTTFHTGSFAGFVDGAIAATFPGGTWAAPTTSMPTVGEAYQLRSLEELITAELELNPGRRVLGKASHDGVDGDTEVRSVEVPVAGGAGEVYLDCLGPSSVTVKSGGGSVTNPCLTTGSYVVLREPGEPVTVTASRDTTWRVVVYDSP